MVTIITLSCYSRGCLSPERATNLPKVLRQLVAELGLGGTVLVPSHHSTSCLGGSGQPPAEEKGASALCACQACFPPMLWHVERILGITTQLI